MRLPDWFLALSLPGRFAVVGGLGLGALGAMIGLVVGWIVYKPTAWAAALEIGLPAAPEPGRSKERRPAWSCWT